MQIHLDVSGFYDWVPIPPGVTVTDDDKARGLVKEMHVGGWSMKVERKLDTQHAMGIPEYAVCDRLVGLALKGEDACREDVVAELAKHSMKQHVAKRHMKSLVVHDEGPQADVMKAALRNRGVDGSRADAILAGYAEGLSGDALAKYLSVILKIQGAK
jgi:hypothetical protein